MAKAIDRNNRISFIEKFRLQNEAEVEMLCKAFKVDRPDWWTFLQNVLPSMLMLWTNCVIYSRIPK